MTQREFAASLGIKPSTLSEYINGRDPSLKVLDRICRQFNVNANWFLTGAGSQTLQRAERYGEKMDWDSMAVGELEERFGQERYGSPQKSGYEVFYERLLEEKERYIRSLEKQLDDLKRKSANSETKPIRDR